MRDTRFRFQQSADQSSGRYQCRESDRQRKWKNGIYQCSRHICGYEPDVGLFQFNNPSGLEKTGTNLLAVTPASGNAMNESTTANLTKSKVLQKYLEGSNVQVADEMVNLIIAQRAYQLNSKAITTSDEMLEQANNLKR